MANTPVETIYTSLKSEYEPNIFVRYPFVFDEAAIPYIYMAEVDDPRLKGFLCDTSGGESRITIGYLSTTFEDCVDQLETIITFVNTLFGVDSPLEVWKVQIQSVRDLTALDIAQQKVFRREFDTIISWGRST